MIIRRVVTNGLTVFYPCSYTISSHLSSDQVGQSK